MIITNNEEALRAPCQPVLQEEAGQLIEQLEKELDYANRVGRQGIGLAGIQCSLNKRVAIVRMPNVKLNLVNAEIKNGYDLLMFREEACLSFPGRVEDTMRHQEIHVINNLVEPYSFIVTGLIAVCVAHEIGHYHADLFFDHKIKKANPVSNIKAKPNEPCPCGKVDVNSGKVKKYKRCCGR
jgi:peptide deformylase